MDKPLTQIVIVGGGSAGRLAAAIIAADHCVNGTSEPGVTVIESPRVGTIGVGEGTWPSMRRTLSRVFRSLDEAQRNPGKCSLQSRISLCSIRATNG